VDDTRRDEGVFDRDSLAISLLIKEGLFGGKEKMGYYHLFFFPSSFLFIYFYTPLYSVQPHPLIAVATGMPAVVLLSLPFNLSQPTNQHLPLDCLALRNSATLVTCRACCLLMKGQWRCLSVSLGHAT
jgi:hypothetical protein